MDYSVKVLLGNRIKDVVRIRDVSNKIAPRNNVDPDQVEILSSKIVGQVFANEAVNTCYKYLRM
jgi:hypothetical protein